MVRILFADDVMNALAEEGRILHLAGKAEGVAFVIVSSGRFLLFLLKVHPEQRLGKQQDSDGAQHAQRICHGIGRCDSRCGICNIRGGRRGIGEGLLGGTQSRRIRYRSGHDTCHDSQVFTAHKVYDISCSNCKEYQGDGKHIHRQTVFAERMEKTGTHLQADGKDKKNQAEILDERQHYGIDSQSQMPQEDSHKQNPSRSQGYSLHFEFTDIQAGSNHQCQDKNGACSIALCKQIHHIAAKVWIKTPPFYRQIRFVSIKSLDDIDK